MIDSRTIAMLATFKSKSEAGCSSSLLNYCSLLNTTDGHTAGANGDLLSLVRPIR